MVDSRDDSRSARSLAVLLADEPGSQQPSRSLSVDVDNGRNVANYFGQRGIRCPLLRPDPVQKERLTAIRANLVERIAEARGQGWLGEVEGLQATLTAADQKLAAMDAIAARKQVVRLGMPTATPAIPTHGNTYEGASSGQPPSESLRHR
jgi:hypothetical protein